MSWICWMTPAAHVVDAVLVEADDDRGDGAVLRHEIAANQLVVQRAPPHVIGASRAGRRR